MWLHILAVPLGIVALIIMLFIAGLIAEYPGQTIGIIALLVLGYGLGATILGL